MIAFITSLRHPDNAVDYGEVERLLQRSLRSVTSQTGGGFVVIVVGNRAPSFRLPPRVHFVQVDFPAPPEPTVREERWEVVIRDKGTKLAVGLLAAHAFSPDFAMMFDADDFVHRGLSEWVARQPREANGWFVSQGWMYSGARGAAKPIRDLHRVCGTCYIVPWRMYEVPDGIGTDASQEELIAAFGERLRWLMGKHNGSDRWLADHGNPLEELPFDGAVYHVDTGENHSRKTLSEPLPMMPRAVAARFSIRHRHPWPVRWWRSSGPGAYPRFGEFLRHADSLRFPRRVFTSLRRRLREWTND